MKSGYIALGLFLVLAVGIFVNAHFLNQAIETSMAEVRRLEHLGNPSPKEAAPFCEEAKTKWEKREKYLMLFVNRNETAAISVLYAQLVAAAKEDMDGDFEVEIAAVLTALEQLDNVSSFKLHYLF